MRFLIRACVFLLLCWCTGAHAACTDGSVYIDANRNGARDPGESGIARVLVSDVKTVVATDTRGRFRLPDATGTVFLVKPAGYALPARTDGLPNMWKAADATVCDF